MIPSLKKDMLGPEVPKVALFPSVTLEEEGGMKKWGRGFAKLLCASLDGCSIRDQRTCTELEYPGREPFQTNVMR